jgi:hypothetical protein
MARPRVVVDLDAEPTRARDLSAGGVYVPGLKLVELAECDLVLRATGRELALLARAVMVTPGGVALELVGFSPDLRSKLAAFTAAAKVATPPNAKPGVTTLAPATPPRAPAKPATPLATPRGVPIRPIPAKTPPAPPPPPPVEEPFWPESDAELEAREAADTPPPEPALASGSVEIGIDPSDLVASRRTRPQIELEGVVRGGVIVVARDEFDDEPASDEGTHVGTHAGAPPAAHDDADEPHEPTAIRKARAPDDGVDDDDDEPITAHAPHQPKHEPDEAPVADAAGDDTEQEDEPLDDPTHAGVHLDDIEGQPMNDDRTHPGLEDGTRALGDTTDSAIVLDSPGGHEPAPEVATVVVAIPDLAGTFERPPPRPTRPETSIPVSAFVESRWGHIDLDDGKPRMASYNEGPSISMDSGPAISIDSSPPGKDDELLDLATPEEPGEAAAGEAAAEPDDPNPEETGTEEERRIARNVHERLRGLNLAQQIKMAQTGESHERIVLERLYGKTVWEALLRNPRLTGPEVARIARMGQLPRPLMEIIVGNGGWLQIPEVRRALLSNPRLGNDQVLRILRLLPKHELKLAVVQTAYPNAVRDLARRLSKGERLG